MFKNLIKIKVLFVSLVFTLMFNTSSSFASNVVWTDWSSIQTGSNGLGQGTLTLGSNIVDVSLNGLIGSFANGDGYYNNAATGYTSPTGTYDGLEPSDLIQEWSTGPVVLNFSRPVINPYIALVSVGSSGNGVTYSFQNPFNVISAGPNIWGYGGYGVSGNNFTGYEYNGILQIPGTYNNLTFNINQGEYWHGFNVGVPVPEPSSMLLGLFGLIGAALGGIKRRFKNQSL